ncbi:MAG: branched-chain amino acid transport system permease protein [Thermoleophilales bacterium]|jgi:ABC-type branched-subunit amino acid transport system permease subunit|nr:branched-chain amino acid transport system permease protein [Thermoleophilales bacterium]
MELSAPLIAALPSAADFSQYVFSGLTQGCLYALIALAFVTIANVTGVYNFAQGDWIMVGGMVAVAGAAGGLPVAVCVVLAMAAVAGVALVQERLTVAPVRHRVGMLGLVVASLGVGVLLRGGALAIWGKDVRSLHPFNDGVFHFLGADLDYQTAWVWGTTALVLVVMLGLFRFTDVGRAMRACAMNPTAARLIGIRVGTMSMSAFVIGGAMSGLIGAVIVPQTGVSWDSGLALGLVGFIAAALARFEDPVRAVVAGLSLGVVQALAAGLVSSAYSDAILYSVLMVYLVGVGLLGADGPFRRLAHRRSTAKARAAAARATEHAGHPRQPIAARDAAPAQRGEAVGPAPSRRASVARIVVGLGVLALALALPVLLESPQARDVAIFIVLSAIGATGLSLVLGVAGQFSLGQAAFYLLGGYTTAILTAQAGWPVAAALLAAMALATFAGLVLGWLTLRLEGFNLAITTLAFHLILLVVVGQFGSLTGGPLGVSGMLPFQPFGIDFVDQSNFYWLALAVLTVCVLVARNLVRSSIGRSLRAIAADEEAAESLALDPVWLKLGTLGIAAAMGGIAGGLWASYLQLAAPTSWDFTLMIALIAYVVVGGAGSVYGGLIGAVVVGALQYLVTGGVTTGLGGGASATQIVMNGALIVGVILLLPGGVAALPGRLRTLRAGRRAAGPRGTDADPGSAEAPRGGSERLGSARRMQEQPSR